MKNIFCKDCNEGCLASAGGCVIYRRRDGGVDVRLRETTHHMNALEFEVVARLFKLALGVSVTTSGYGPVLTRHLEDEGYKRSDDGVDGQ